LSSRLRRRRRKSPTPALIAISCSCPAASIALARDGARHTVFLVTTAGIIVGDPLSTSTATWLRDELAARFPGRAVRYVLHTHHHFDRAEGAGIFRPAERVGHSRFNEELSRARRVAPTFLDALDRNGNGVFESDELAGRSSAPLLLSKDRNGDGQVSADELYRQIQDVRRTYHDTIDLALGGRIVRMIHTGRAHAADMSVLFFPAERIVFAAEPPPVASVPFLFGPFRPSDTFDWIHAVAPLDFDTLLFADGTSLPRAQLTALATYLDALREEVAIGREQGWTLARLQAGSTVSSRLYDSGRNGHLATIYRTLGLTRVVLSGSGLGSYGFRDSRYCEAFPACSTGGAVPAGAAALSVSSGPLGFGAELQLGAQSWHSRTNALHDEEFALRETRVAAMVRYGKPRPGLAFSIAGGPSFTIGDAQGLSREKNAVAPLGGRHPLAGREHRLGVTVGVDVERSISPRMSFIMPIRVTRFLGKAPADLWPGNTTVTIGGGLSMRVVRRLNQR